VDDALGESELAIIFGESAATRFFLGRVVLFVADTSNDVGLGGVLLLYYEVAFGCAVAVQSYVGHGSFQYFLGVLLDFAVGPGRQ
jgi:hypothetical protein